MKRRILLGLVLAGAVAMPAFAQTAGTWGGDANTVVLSAADGSSVLTFSCDAQNAALVVTSTYAAGAAPQRITVRANNGTAYSVPLQPARGADELVGGISTSLINQDRFAAATTLIVSAPPSGRPEIIVDTTPALAALISACPRA